MFKDIAPEDISPLLNLISCDDKLDITSNIESHNDLSRLLSDISKSIEKMESILSKKKFDKIPPLSTQILLNEAHIFLLKNGKGEDTI